MNFASTGAANSDSPAFESGEPDPARWARRLVSLLGVHLALAFLLASAPLWLPLLALVGIFQRG